MSADVSAGGPSSDNAPVPRQSFIDFQLSLMAFEAYREGWLDLDAALAAHDVFMDSMRRERWGERYFPNAKRERP